MIKREKKPRIHAGKDWHKFEKTFVVRSAARDAIQITKWALGIVNSKDYGPEDASGIYAFTVQARSGWVNLLWVTLYVRADQQNFDWTKVHIPGSKPVGTEVTRYLQRGFAMIGFANNNTSGYTLGLMPRKAKRNRPHIWEYEYRRNIHSWIPRFLNTHSPANASEIVGMISQDAAGKDYNIHVWCRRNPTGSTRWAASNLKTKPEFSLQDQVHEKLKYHAQVWRGIAYYSGSETDVMIGVSKS